MQKVDSLRKVPRRWGWEAGALLLVLCVAPARSYGQAIVETATTTSLAGGVTATGTKNIPVSLPTSVPEITHPDEENRKALEQRAGQDAAKVLLQSTPSEARAYVDGAIVGRTPLLLILPPGKYKVEMRGQREEFGERLIELPANETQRIVLNLVPHFPTGYSLQSGIASTTVGNPASGAKRFPPSLEGPAADGNPGYPAVSDGAALGETNRKALEQNAGSDAAKLVLTSVPSEAFTYIDGTFVGRTPIAVIVSTGRYKVEMRGPRQEYGERTVGVLPNESQQVEFKLAVRYPASISLH